MICLPSRIDCFNVFHVAALEIDIVMYIFSTIAQVIRNARTLIGQGLHHISLGALNLKNSCLAFPRK